MRSPLEVIAGYGLSTSSYIQAIRQFNDLDNPVILNKKQYETAIAEIVGSDTPPSFSNEKESRIYFLYVVQETIRAFGHSVPSMEDVWVEAQRRAKNMIESQPWAIIDYAAERNETPKIDAAGKPKKRKGAKKAEAEALYRELNDGNNDRLKLIEALMSQVGLTKGGATTYFHNMKKRFGFKGPEVKKIKQRKEKSGPVAPPRKKTLARKGPTKAEIAGSVYNEMKSESKEKIIEEIIKRTGTTKAGANTYYCSCKKKDNS